MKFLWSMLGLLLVLPFDAHALEPASALEDAFASAPSLAGAADTVYNFPGMEHYMSSRYAAGAYQVPFGMDDLAVSTGYAGFSTGMAAAFASFSGSGFDLYGEEHAKLGLSFAPVKVLSVGMRLTRSAIRIKGYGDTSALSGDIGVVMRPIDRLFLACSVEDIAAAELGESKEALDGRTRFALSWLSPADVTLFASASKVRRVDTSFTLGFLAELTGTLTFGFAGANEPDRIEYIAGVRLKNTRFAYRGWYHGELGATHGFSLGYCP